MFKKKQKAKTENNNKPKSTNLSPLGGTSEAEGVKAVEISKEAIRKSLIDYGAKPVILNDSEIELRQRKLHTVSFRIEEEQNICDFVNENNAAVERIALVGNRYILFYWKWEDVMLPDTTNEITLNQ